jgi:hypothetical protein
VIWAYALQAPLTANAANLSLGPSGADVLSVTDVANERNAMVVRAAPGKLIFEDSSAPLTTTALQCVAATPGRVECASTGISSLTAQLGGGDDSFVLDDSISTVAAVTSASIDGGAGQDVLTSGAGAQTLLGGTGRDHLAGGAGNDIVVAGDGDDELSGGAGDDVLSGENGGDLLYGDAGSDRLHSGPGDDSLTGGPGPDTLVGGLGVNLVVARDGSPDAISCGGRLDLAIVDPLDAVQGCEQDHIDNGRRLRPRRGETARAIPASGGVKLRLAGAMADRFYPLEDVADIPLGSALDPSGGTVRVRTTKGRSGSVQEASFRRGKFTVDQARTATPVTEIRLIGGNFAACDRSSRGKTSASVPLGHEGRAPIQRLETRIGSRRGRVRVIGHYVSGVAHGTAWLTEDRCDGGDVRVLSGGVEARDRTTGRTRYVWRGQTFEVVAEG